jgi:hypothetical protein
LSGIRTHDPSVQESEDSYALDRAATVTGLQTLMLLYNNVRLDDRQTFVSFGRSLAILLLVIARLLMEPIVIAVRFRGVVGSVEEVQDTWQSQFTLQ